jgi:hypothetical protein
MKDRNAEQVMLREGHYQEQGEQIWLMYFLCMYEYGILRPVKVTLRRGKRKREYNEGDEPNQGTLHDIWKCHHKTPCTTIINQ